MMQFKTALLALFVIFFTQQQSKAQQNKLSNTLQKHVNVLASDSLEGRGLGTEGINKARHYITSEFIKAGIQPLKGGYAQNFSTKIRLAWVQGQNIVGIVKGSDPVLSNEYIVIGAHYDHLGYDNVNNQKVIYPGADDNASGVASIIELGRYFVQNKHLLRRSLVIIAFDAEESGLLGSNFFVTDTIIKMSQVKAMFSFDMVGMLNKYNGLDLPGIETIQDVKPKVMELAQAHEIKIKSSNSKIVANTDTSPFGKIGIPAVHVFTGTVSPYHKPEDKSDLLDYEGMEKINLFMRDVLTMLVQSDQLLPDGKFAASIVSTIVTDSIETIVFKPVRKTIFGVRFNNGAGYHNYNKQFFYAKSVYNFETGLYAQYNLNKMFTMQHEVLYDYNGSKHQLGRFSRHSVTAPVNLMMGTRQNAGDGLRIFILAGAYYRYNFGGKVADNKLDYTNEYERNEWGINYGFLMHTKKFQIGWTHRNGISPLAQKPQTKMTAISSMFSLGFNL